MTKSVFNLKLDCHKGANVFSYRSIMKTRQDKTRQVPTWDKKVLLLHPNVFDKMRGELFCGFKVMVKKLAL